MWIQGKQGYLWRAVDQNGKAVDVFLCRRAYRKAAKRLLRKYEGEPRKIGMNKLRS